MKIYFDKKLNINDKSIEQFKTKAKLYIFELCFYIYLVAKYSFQTSIFVWNKSIDFLNVNLPITITDTFPLHSFKINRDDHDSFKYICYTYTFDEYTNTNKYTRTYTHDVKQVMKNINSYDYIVVNHYGGLKNKELFKRLFTKEDIDIIQKDNKILDDYEILKTNPFVYLSVNYNSKHKDFNLNKNQNEEKVSEEDMEEIKEEEKNENEQEQEQENNNNNLDIDETLDCYLKLKQYYVKGNRIDRDFLHFLFMNEYNVNLHDYPSYIIDVIDNNITEKRYTINDNFIYKL